MWCLSSQSMALGFWATLLSTAAAASATSEASQPPPPGYYPPLNACDILARSLPGDVNFPNSTMYIQENRYWSNRQAEVHPRCFVTPRKTADVSVVMRTLTSLGAPFTVKSGGHTAYEGGSNIADGVTVDLLYLNDIVVSADRQTVSVGPGNRWINVSHVLDPLNLAVVAGRVSDVGVGGLILGGGISYFSGSRGWACDNVRNFEIVLASGQVVNASPTKNTDLFWALRGGVGANFGVVTRFDLAAFPQGDIWSQSVIFPGVASGELLSLYTDLSQRGLVQDPKAHTYLVQTYTQQFGGFITLGSFYHAQPPPKDTFPVVFQPFQSVPGALVNTTQVVNISTQSLAIDQPYGSRQTWWDTSVAMSSPELFEEITSVWQQFVLRTVQAANGTDFLPFLILQPISQNVIDKMQQNGGNALGLKPKDGPLMLVQLAAEWAQASLDPVVEQGLEELVGEIERRAKAKGLYRGFVYVNYAGKKQDPLRRYGQESYKRLQDVAKKYDPKGQLNKLWRGYFQVERDD